jgi:hypothetical protein
MLKRADKGCDAGRDGVRAEAEILEKQQLRQA